MKDTDKVYKVRVMQIEEELTLRVPEGVKIENKNFITETFVTHKNSTNKIIKKEVPIT